MFSTEIIINAMLYAMNQAMDSNIDVLNTADSACDLYNSIVELCKEWGIDETMLQGCWRFDADVWDACAKRSAMRHTETTFTFKAASCTINVVVHARDMVFFVLAPMTLDEALSDTELSKEGTDYMFYDLTDGVRYYEDFTGFVGHQLTKAESKELIMKVTACDGLDYEAYSDK